MSAGTGGIEGVAAEASARVGEILAEAEHRARGIDEEAERDAAATIRDAENEAERIAAEAREAARSAAGERAERLTELQAALTARGPALVEGLEGSGLTRARLEALIEALVAIRERVVEGAQEGDLEETAFGEPEPEPEAAAASADPADTAAPDADRVAAAEELAQPVHGSATSDGNGDGGNGRGPVPYEGPLPEGAPMARRPMRPGERDARFAALLLAVQGRDRDDVEAHLRREYDFAECQSILDEVFGRTPA